MSLRRPPRLAAGVAAEWPPRMALARKPFVLSRALPTVHTIPRIWETHTRQRGAQVEKQSDLRPEGVPFRSGSDAVCRQGEDAEAPPRFPQWGLSPPPAQWRRCRPPCLPLCPLAAQYRPKALEQFELHSDVAQNLQKLVRQRLNGLLLPQVLPPQPPSRALVPSRTPTVVTCLPVPRW